MENLMKLIISFFAMTIIFINTAYCNDWEKYKEEYRAAENIAAKFTASLPKLFPEEMKVGKFTVNPSQGYYEVTYKLKDKKIFSKKLKMKGLDDFSEVFIIDAEGYSSLFLNVRANKFQYVVYPSIKNNGFKYVGVGNEMEGRTAKLVNVDSSINKEIVMLLKLMPEYCTIYKVNCIMATIFKISPDDSQGKGELIDISEKYPNYIRQFINKCKQNLKSIETPGLNSAEATNCREYIRGYINSAENRLLGTRALPDAPPPPPPMPPR